MMLRLGNLNSVPTWLGKMDRIVPDHVQTVQLRVKWLDATGKSAQIPGVVEPVIETALGKIDSSQPAEQQTLQKAQLMGIKGSLYGSVKMFDRAEQAFRTVEQLNPPSYQPLVQVLAAQGKMGGIVIAALPFGLFFIMYFLNPDVQGQLFKNGILGWAMIAVGLVMQSIGAFIIKQMVAIEM